MNLSLLTTRAIGSGKFFVSKNAPSILTGAGVVGFAVTTALTIRATAKAVEVMPEISEDIAKTKAANQGLEKIEQQKALAHTYLKQSLKLAEIYWPVILSGSASIVCVMSAHNIMAKRQASLLAAYSALDAGFKAYRRRVSEELGPEKELELYRRVKTVTQESDEEGVPPCEIVDQDDVMPSPYARFFDELNPNWTKTPEYNLFFLRAQQDWANDRLRAYGFVFLNEVYESLGLPRSQAGQIVGWKLDGEGDGFVDFGLYDIGDETNRAFINGIEHTVLLDFNVDGPIRIS